jgi:hypothetical protein
MTFRRVPAPLRRRQVTLRHNRAEFVAVHDQTRQSQSTQAACDHFDRHIDCDLIRIAVSELCGHQRSFIQTHKRHQVRWLIFEPFRRLAHNAERVDAPASFQDVWLPCLFSFARKRRRGRKTHFTGEPVALPLQTVSRMAKTPVFCQIHR